MIYNYLRKVPFNDPNMSRNRYENEYDILNENKEKMYKIYSSIYLPLILFLSVISLPQIIISIRNKTIDTNNIFYIIVGTFFATMVTISGMAFVL